MLKRIFEAKKVKESWRKRHNYELGDSYYSPNVIGIFRTRRIKFVSHVTCTGETRNLFESLVRKSERRLPFGRVNGKIVLKWNLKGAFRIILAWDKGTII
jgi:hypothetical protein